MNNLERVKFSRDNEYMIVYIKEQAVLFKKTPCYLKNEKYYIDIKKYPVDREKTAFSDIELTQIHQSIEAYVNKTGVFVSFVDN